MPKACSVAVCRKTKYKRPDLEYFIIPKDPVRREKWLAFLLKSKLEVEEAVENWPTDTRFTYVCSLHFITGKDISTTAMFIDSIADLRPKKTNCLVIKNENGLNVDLKMF